jgi:hypothetical protein
MDSIEREACCWRSSDGDHAEQSPQAIDDSLSAYTMVPSRIIIACATDATIRKGQRRYYNSSLRVQGAYELSLANCPQRAAIRSKHLLLGSHSFSLDVLACKARYSSAKPHSTNNPSSQLASLAASPVPVFRVISTFRSWRSNGSSLVSHVDSLTD